MIKINNFIPEKTFYPDGTMKLTLPSDLFYGEHFDFCWKYENENEILELFYLANQIKQNVPIPIMTLFMPYLPNARMDRIHNETEVFTLKYFCNIINSIGFACVKIVDCHSPVGVALLDNVVNETPKYYIKKAMNFANINPNDCLFFPDEGSQKRYAEMFPVYKNIAFGIKKRDWETGKIQGLDIHGSDVKDKYIFIIDDICSYGGTVYHSAKKLKELGCKDISVFFTHCEDSIVKGDLYDCDLIKHIYTTNSICSIKSNNKITVIDII